MAYEIHRTDLPESEAVSIRTAVPLEELQAFFGEAFHKLSEAIELGGANPGGPPFVRYYSVSPTHVEVEAVMPCDSAVLARGRVHPLRLSATPAAYVRHVGHYEKLRPAYDAITEWMSEHGKHATEPPRELYVTSPAEDPDPSEWVTLVEQPID